VIDAFVESIDLGELGFDGVVPETTGRPAYHPSVLLKLYIYGYLNRVQSSRRLEREAGRNVEVMWLIGRLVPDHKTIADFRKDNGRAIRQVCTRFVGLCREMGLLAAASVAIDGSKFKAVNNRDRNFTRAKMDGGVPRSRRASRATCSSSIPPTARSPPRRSRPRLPG
jgi:transposase